MQRRILVPLDGSALADHILRLLERVLVREEHEVVLLRVVPGDADPSTFERQREDAHDHLEGVRDALVDGGALASVEVLVGDPAGQIVEHAARLGAELIVMATHGRSGLSRFVRGSVAEEVIRRSATPVLVANPRAVAAGAAEGELALRRLLVPLDGSDLALQVLPLVEGLAARSGAEVLLLHAEWRPLVAEGLAARVPPAPAEAVTAVLEPARLRLEARGLRVRSLAGHGPAALAILDAADREQVDLVVMSTHGRRGAARWLFGSVAEQVIRHCARPLLVRRMSAEEAREPAPSARGAHDDARR